MKKRITIRLLAISIVASGCGLQPPKPKQMYAGPALPLAQVAVIGEGSRAWIYVLKIDGQYIVNPIIGGAPFTKGLHVLPGKHLITAKYMNVDSFGATDVLIATSIQDLPLETKVGHTYVVRGIRNSDKYMFWFDDKGENYNQECLTPNNYQKVFVEMQSVPTC